MRNKKRNRIMLLLVLLLGITVGFAALATTLKINGNASITKNTWSVHWDDTPANIHVTEGSVSADPPTVGKEEDEDPEKSLLSWSATLDKPGDFYEFTADVVNDGSIDGMISEIVSKVNGEVIPNDPSEPSPLPKYAKYSVTYGDGEKIEEDHLIAANSRETYKIRIEYTDDINPSDLDNIPPAGKSLTFTFRLAHAQATEDAKDRKAKVTCPGPECVYAVLNGSWNFGENGTILQPTDYSTTIDGALEGKDTTGFVAMILDEGRIDRVFLCEKVETASICLEGVRGVADGGTTENLMEIQRENNAKVKEYFPALTGETFEPEYIEARDEYSIIIHQEDGSYIEYSEKGSEKENALWYNQSNWGIHAIGSSIDDSSVGMSDSMVVSLKVDRVWLDTTEYGQLLSTLECMIVGNGQINCEYAHR